MFGVDSMKLEDVYFFFFLVKSYSEYLKHQEHNLFKTSLEIWVDSCTVYYVIVSDTPASHFHWFLLKGYKRFWWWLYFPHISDSLRFEKSSSKAKMLDNSSLDSCYTGYNLHKQGKVNLFRPLFTHLLNIHIYKFNTRWSHRSFYSPKLCDF